VNGSGAACSGWDLLVSPWHLNEQIETFPVPVGAIELIERSDPAVSELDRLTRPLKERRGRSRAG
jgi:hypothetical protein